MRRYLIGAIVGAGLTLALLWALEPEPVPEPPAPATTLPSGAVVAERVPDAPLPPVAREAARELGGETVRAGHVVVQPRTPDAAPSEMPAAGSAGPVAPCLCIPDPIRLDWSLTRVDDGHRMSWWTDGGTITGATDIPVSGVSVRRDRPWAAGASWTPGKREYGLWASREVGRLVIGAEVQQREREGLVGMLRVGWRF